MQKVIDATGFQRGFRAVFAEVAPRRVPYALTRGSRPEAALIPSEEFLRFRALQESDVLARFDWLMARMAARNAAHSATACRDPKDTKVLEAAVAGQADVIVSGDEDLGALHPVGGILTVGPAEFLGMLEGVGHS